MDDDNYKPIKTPRESLKIALIYCAVSIIWIISSDFLLIRLFGENKFMFYRVQSFKGIIFVVVTSIMIYLLVQHSLNKIQMLDKTIKNKVNMLNIKKEVLNETRIDYIKQKSLIDNVLSNTFIIILSLDSNCRIISANDNFFKLTKFEEVDIIGKDIGDFFIYEKEFDFCKLIEGKKLEKPITNIETVLKYNCNEKSHMLLGISPSKDKSGLIDEFIVIGMDITKTKHLEETIHYLGSFDTTTGLPNRHYLEEEFNNIRSTLDNEDSDLAFLYIGIDNFNQVNETYGHYAGDNLLVRIGEIIQEEISNKNLISRISNDSFAIILTDVLCKDQLNNRITRLQELIRRPWEFQGEEFFISTTIGATIMEKNGEEFATLLKKAGIAMEYCKKNNKGGYHYYSQDIQKQVLDDVSLLGDIRKALLNKEFSLNYQIIYDLQLDKIYGVEALIRWKHPERGYISPMDFIPLAEKTNLIYEITDFVLDEALMQKKKWNDQGLDISKVGINISAKSFDSEDLVDIIEEKLKRFGIGGDELVLEITESGFIENLNNVNKNVSKLMKSRIQVSLDDFGTGYSSLSRLKDIYVNYIKLDRTFVMNIEKDKDLKAMVASVIDITQNLELKVVAEGIETENQLMLLKELGCDLGQGYHIHKPMPAAELEALIR